MRMTEYMEQEEDYVPWKTALNEFLYPDTMLIRTSIYPLWTKHMRKQIALFYQNNGWDYEPQEQLAITLKRQEATSFACRWDVAHCLSEASRLFLQWMENPTDVIGLDPNLRQTAYCHGIQEGGGDEWNFAWGEAVKMENEWPAEYQRLLQAMACATEPWILNRYLSWTMDASRIKHSDAADVITAVANNANVGRYLAWDFLRVNWEELVVSVLNTTSRAEEVINAIVYGFNQQFHKDEFLRFVESISYPEEYNSVWEKAEETINANIKYMETSYDELKEWLEGLDAGKIKHGRLH